MTRHLRSQFDIASERAIGGVVIPPGVDAGPLRADPQNAYDAVDTRHLRRRSTVETRDEGGIYTARKRGQGANLGRDLERNYPPAAGLLHQFRVNVVGSLGKIRVNTEGGDTAASWFNQVWSQDCDYRSVLHWSEWLANTLAGVIREGDQLTVFDDQVTPDDTGQLISWETDQIASADKNILPADYRDMVQDNGIIRDKLGREVAYIASGKRGLAKITKAEDMSIYPRGVARLICNPWRQNQGRGVPGLVTSAAHFQDMYELITSEVQSAKRAAMQYAFVKRTDAVTDWDNPGDDPEWLPENAGKTAATVDAEGPNVATAPGQQGYERLENMTGGHIDYMDDGDSVEFPDMGRPNPDVAAFLDNIHGASGGGLGLASAYTKQKAEKSYTAFRGDMVMTWVTFRWYQKWLERKACDWVARKALSWAMRHKHIPALPAGWESSLSWQWPRMPEVDGLKAQQASLLALQNGTTDYGELIGPDWRDHFDALAEQYEYAMSKGLPLSAFGAIAPIANPVTTTSDED